MPDQAGVEEEEAAACDLQNEVPSGVSGGAPVGSSDDQVSSSGQ